MWIATHTIAEIAATNHAKALSVLRPIMNDTAEVMKDIISKINSLNTTAATSFVSATLFTFLPF
ncbi:MAG: hypothetical protein M0R50_09160 [Candidatus Cloacimonetes bacterium]|nr:hypothetical protein [Candidatus Cloacimonadota bacterium]